MRRLRRDLGFRRIAIVLSGGGALGAYEVGTLKVLEALAVVPSLVAGVSIGAINAAVWVAHGRRAAAICKPSCATCRKAGAASEIRRGCAWSSPVS